jgi:hypothetical protein
MVLVPWYVLARVPVVRTILAVGVKDGFAIMTSGLQCIYNEGRKEGRSSCDFLLIATHTERYYARRSCGAGLYRYCPQLVSWFIITCGEDPKLFHSIHGYVGNVHMGVKRGDPLSTLFFAVAIQAAKDEIDEDIMNLHPGSDTARAAAFADDGVVVGEALLSRFPHYAARIYELTGLHVEMSKSVLVVSGGAAPAVMAAASRLTRASSRHRRRSGPGRRHEGSVGSGAQSRAGPSAQPAQPTAAPVRQQRPPPRPRHDEGAGAALVPRQHRPLQRNMHGPQRWALQAASRAVADGAAPAADGYHSCRRVRSDDRRRHSLRRASWPHTWRHPGRQHHRRPGHVGPPGGGRHQRPTTMPSRPTSPCKHKP